MTHDELLAKIYWHWKNADDSEYYGLGGYRKALRAVVELHRPEEIKLTSGEVADTYCFECEGLINYPCPTINESGCVNG